MIKGQVITEAYRKMQQHLHETTKYGTASVGYAPLVKQIVDKLEISHLLDYGCGKRMALIHALNPKNKLTYQGYDPGVPELAGDPVPAQMVACIDVLEHVEPEFLDSVMDHLAALTEVVAFMTVHCGPAYKILPDGRNAHLTQEPPSWWIPKFNERFDIQTFQMSSDKGFYVIAHPRAQIESVDGKKLVA